MNKNYLFLAGLIIIAALYPITSSAYITVGISVLLFTGWATSWNLLGGWAGQLSLGHASFVGLGAYFVAIGSSQFGLAPWWSILVAMAVAAVMALIWGKLTFGLRGPYFSLSTIAIAEILRLVAINESWLTGGASGVFIDTLPQPFGVDLFDQKIQYYLALLYAAVTIAVTIFISSRRFGYQLKAVRDNEEAAMAAGINPSVVKLKAFVLSGAMTALGGGIYGIFLSFIEPHIIFNLLFSIQIALTVIIGGRGTIWGPAVGAALLVISGEIFRTAFAQANMLVYGVLILVVILVLPRGVVGEYAHKLIRRKYANRA
ncbi:branched-chain amino acid ABC transporter permease [Bordetella genomosp. 4]|uniref:Branched-chain amino acid ABC transporter permease n=1 Tax=Bordetella genomosp. 4 TaxID=463044 RepID=A0A261U5D4_9BORD|nr:branched-chain amino acid ABC transporter permease [Bordetella genomosp. 4]OZI48608.1 branched-chain amino acid ABC transporter permease [Bordetella genomosp. 4]OZI56632.1 branched-chain amino acid ABC transporter permease [Bordetella genomosp. 4]